MEAAHHFACERYARAKCRIGGTAKPISQYRLAVRAPRTKCELQRIFSEAVAVSLLEIALHQRRMNMQGSRCLSMASPHAASEVACKPVDLTDSSSVTQDNSYLMSARPIGRP